MNEMAFAMKVAEHLSVATQQMDAQVAARLHAARERALQVQRPATWWEACSWQALKSRLGLALAPGLRSSLVALVLLVTFVGGEYWATLSRAEAVQQVDAALLIDDLPIEAYLDPEFRRWLAHKS